MTVSHCTIFEYTDHTTFKSRSSPHGLLHSPCYSVCVPSSPCKSAWREGAPRGRASDPCSCGIPVLAAQTSFTIVESVVHIPHKIHVKSVNGRRAIRGTSERERLFVTDVRQIDAAEVAIAIDHPVTTRSS